MKCLQPFYVEIILTHKYIDKLKTVLDVYGSYGNLWADVEAEYCTKIIQILPDKYYSMYIE